MHGNDAINDRGYTVMRRILIAFLTALGVCVVASFIFAVVAHIDGTSRLIYPLGALVVVPVPVMLVLLFFLMRQGLSAEPAGDAAGGEMQMEAEVAAAVARSFPIADRAPALMILASYGARPHESERARVRLAIVRLGVGDLDRLRYFTDQAKQDYRDVLAWDAEPSATSSD